MTITAFIIFTAVSSFSQTLCFESDSPYTFYCGTSSKDCKIVTVKDNARAEKLALKNVCGESCEYFNLDIAEFLKSVDGEILFCEELDDSINYYCKADLPYSVQLYGKEINLHICMRGENVKVASPIIFGGY